MLKSEVNEMHSAITVQKMNAAPLCACEGAFHSSFYMPYEAAACSLFPTLCAARAALCAEAGVSPVRTVTYRLKSPSSVREKLRKKGLPENESAASAALHDIAGMRVVLSSVDDVYRYAALIRQSPGIECFGEHDYIAKPKPSGYQSLHLLLRVPVCCAGESLMVPVELQLRTEAMDLWASIEHALCYKPVNPR